MAVKKTLSSEPHYVFIKRKRGFIVAAQDQKEVDNWESNAKSEIGSYFDRQGNMGTGFEDQNLLQVAMEEYLRLKKDDDTARYWKGLEKYYTEIFSIIPKGGLKLNIALRDQNKPFSKSNMPQNMQDYLKYVHHKSHPEVASSETASNSTLAKYYIEDTRLEQEASDALQDTRDEALGYYMKVKNSPEGRKLAKVLAKDFKQYSADYRRTHPKASANGFLNDFAMSKPKEFIKYATDKDIVLRYDIYRMMGYKILLVTGQAIHMEGKFNDPLGYSIDEVISFLKNENENSETIAILRQQLAEREKLTPVKKQ